MRRLVNLAPGAAARHANGARRGIDVDGLHGREVNHQPVVNHRQSGPVVAAATNGDVQLIPAGKGHGCRYVGRVGATDDQRRVLVNHGVVEGARLIVARVSGRNEIALKSGRQTANGFPVKRNDCSLHHGSSFSQKAKLSQPIAVRPAAFPAPTREQCRPGNGRCHEPVVIS